MIREREQVLLQKRRIDLERGKMSEWMPCEHEAHSSIHNLEWCAIGRREVHGVIEADRMDFCSGIRQEAFRDPEQAPYVDSLAQLFLHLADERFACGFAKPDPPAGQDPEVRIIHSVEQDMPFLNRYSDHAILESLVTAGKINIEHRVDLTPHDYRYGANMPRRCSLPTWVEYIEKREFAVQETDARLRRD
jgi:hypothetical protein